MRTLSDGPSAGASLISLALLLLPACSEPRRETVPTPRFVPDTKPPPPVRWQEVTIEPGTELVLKLEEALGSGTGRPGDAFRARVAKAIVVDGLVAIAEGSIVEGVISEAAPAGRAKARGGRLALEFRRIRTPTGAEAEFRARHAVSGAAWRDVRLEVGAPITVVVDQSFRINVRF
ncbi:MAG: hypothetical protein ACE5JH_08240 [Acidobacteriota bacterium]